MFDIDEFLKKINEIELSLKHKHTHILGQNIFPIIRICLQKQTNSIDFGRREKFSLKVILYHILDLLRFFKLFKMRHKNLFLVYGTDKSGKVTLNNNLIDKHFTPFEDKFGRENISFIEFGYIDPSVVKSNSLNITLLYYLAKPFLNIFFKVILKKEIHELELILSKNKSINIDHLSKSIIDFFSKASFFKFLVKFIIRPKNVFVKSFNNITAMAIVNVANQLSINTIEFQHGQQGENSLSYSNWNNVPKSGFELLPKYFWIWEHRFRNKFDKWMQKQNFHKVIVGGNLWYDYSQKMNNNLELNLNKNLIHVLYCLQYSELNEIVVEAMKLSKNIFWHIRLHPREKHKLNKIHDLLINNRIDSNKFSLNEANNFSFEELVINIDVVVSEWSTVLYEAYCFNKKPITISNHGKLAYNQFIREGSIFHANKSKKLLNIINRNLIGHSHIPKFNYEAVKFLNIVNQ
jgi:hypothetical protein